MNNHEKATLVATEISDDEPFAQSDAVQCLASEFLILKKRHEDLTKAVKKIAFLSGDFGEAIKNNFTEHTLIVKESVVYEIQQVLQI